jgi:hypothetical protein
VSGRNVPQAEQQLVELVMADYDSTQRALAGFVTSGGQLRAIGIAAWGVVFAQALQSRSVTVSVFAVMLPLVFAVGEGYYSALYRQALGRVRAIEALLGEYHNSLGIHASNPNKVARAVAALEQHRFGVHRDMRPVNKDRTWWLPRPVRVTWIYSVLLLVSVANVVKFAF